MTKPELIEWFDAVNELMQAEKYDSDGFWFFFWWLEGITDELSLLGEFDR